MKSLMRYLKDSTHELTLVTWPKQDQLLKMTTITVVFVMISAFLLGLVDFSLTKAYQWFLTLGA